MQAKKHEWVEIENIVFNPKERTASLPEDTKTTPLKMWIRGFLINETAEIGEKVKIMTLAQRVLEGKLVEIKPRHIYDYGETVPELLEIGEELKSELRDEVKN